VAKKAGTSIATVSYVFSNAERYLRPELRERVLLAAAEIGYVKNAAASSLKGKRRGILAVLVAQFGNTFFTRMCVEIVSIARQEGYVVTLCNSEEDLQQERIILERLVAQRIDGCILCPALSKDDNTDLLKQHRIPYVILERSFPDSFSMHNFVGHDNFQSGYLATKYLLDAGHRQIAFSGWDSPIPNVRERVDGYRAALQEYDISKEDELMLTDELSEAAGRRMAEKLTASAVTAVVLGQHDTAKGTLQYFQDVGVRWPTDLSLVMIGTPEWASVLRPRLTCIQRPEQQMGRSAATLLLETIRKPDQQPNQHLFSCIVSEGESVIRR
jgi:DNA-binding LacI/PurR family transcriptional regulator